MALAFAPPSTVTPRELPVTSSFEIVAEFPHDPDAYCQGLVFDGGIMFEGTGLNGKSSLRRVDLKTGKVLKIVPLEKRLFGEGITVWKDQIIQVTWKTGEGFVYDKESLRLIKKFRYSGQGWGLTHDDKHLILSDGSATLRFLDPETFKVVKRVEVRCPGRMPASVDQLNELEYVNGEVLANIWYEDVIARIDPASGRVLGWIDLKPLVAASGRKDEHCVLNGIAWDATDERLFVTGKNWPRLYEIRIK